jgi:hypothetical protein
MTFFNNCAQWINDHQIEIITVLQVIQASGLVGVVVSFIKGCLINKAAKKDNEEINKKLDDMQTKLTEAAQPVEMLQEQIAVISYKVNTMLDVQALVYSTIKNEETRNIVQTKIAAAKNYTIKAAADIASELEKVQQKTEELLKENAETVRSTIKQVKAIVNATDSDVER